MTPIDLDNVEHWASLVDEPGRTVVLDLVAEIRSLRSELEELAAENTRLMEEARP